MNIWESYKESASEFREMVDGWRELVGMILFGLTLLAIFFGVIVGIAAILYYTGITR